MVSLVDIDGGSPRPIGSQMAVAEDGKRFGFLTGGCAEEAIATEAGAIFAASNALLERITFKEGAIEQSNFDDYHVMKLADAPNVHVELIQSEREPSGIADPVVVGVPAAIANSFAALSNGKRLYQLPFTEDRVKAVLGK